MKRLPLLSALVLVAVLGFLLWQRENREPEPEFVSTPENKDEVDPEKEAPNSIVKKVENPYTTGEASRDGTGRFYQGREIAQVMGHRGIKWLERKNRETEEAPTIAIELIELEPGEVLADIGAGSGYYSFRLAMKHPESEVIGVDIQQEMLDFLENRKSQLGVKNIQTHLGLIDDIALPEESIDAALMVDAYHEFSHPHEMMHSIVRALRPDGRVILLEYRAEDPNVPIKPLHKMTQEQVKKEMAFVGLEWEQTLDQLPWQHLMIFRKP